MAWFVWQDGKHLGPLTDAEVRARLDAGQMTARDPVRRAGSARWTPLGLVRELSPDRAEGPQDEPRLPAGEATVATRRRWLTVAIWTVIGLGLPAVAALLVSGGAPQLWEYAVMVTDHDPTHVYQVRELGEPSEVEISGYIAFGLAERLRTFLDAHPAVRTVRLDSSGGRVVEARKVRNLIAVRRLSTFTSRRCTSACVIPFLAGESRTIAPGAVIGFHQYTVDGVASRRTRQDMEADKTYFLSRGVAPGFVARAFEATSVLWRPTPEQMLAAGFITGYTAGADER